MAARTFLFIVSLLYLVNFTIAFSLQHVMARLNALEAKFDMENKLRRSETEELFRRVSEISINGKMITASEHVSHDSSSDHGEHASPKANAALLDRTTIMPYTDKNKSTKNKTTENAFELQKLKSYLTEGAKVEKDKNLKLRTELKDIGDMLKTDFSMFESNIKEEVRNLTDNLSQNKKSLEIDYASFKSNIKDFVSTALSIASNETRQTIISLKSDFYMSLSVISNNVRTMSKTLANINNRQTEIDISMQEFSNGLSSMNKTITNNTDIQSDFNSSIQKLAHIVNLLKRSCPISHSPYSGVYDIYPGEKSVSSVRVYCDQTTDGGGWLVFQRRQDGSVDFERTWADYKTGFGNLEGEFWLGNDNLHALTSAGFNELRIDLEDFEGNKAYAKYSHFNIKSESEKYVIKFNGYSGDAGDSLAYHNGMPFSTKDRDNDNDANSCSEYRKGAWWYKACHHSNLNGFYYRGANSPTFNGVNWGHWKGYDYSLKRVEMKIR